jgi:hypothetical protein
MISGHVRRTDNITAHAEARMMERRLTRTDVEAALSFGREVHTRGITIYAIGQKEVEMASLQRLDISKLEGIHVLCSRDGDIVTTYRNFDLRGLRPRHRTRSDRFLRSRLAA